MNDDWDRSAFEDEPDTFVQEASNLSAAQELSAD